MKTEVTIKFPLYRVADLLCSALEGGAMFAEIKEQIPPTNEIDLSLLDTYEKVYPHLHYPLFAGGKLVIEDRYERCSNTGIQRGTTLEYILDENSIESGMKVFSEKYTRHFANWVLENDDAETGDVFLQCCLFGEVKYS